MEPAKGEKKRVHFPPQMNTPMPYLWSSSIPRLWRLISVTPPMRPKARVREPRDTPDSLHELYISKLYKPPEYCVGGGFKIKVSRTAANSPIRAVHTRHSRSRSEAVILRPAFPRPKNKFSLSRAISSVSPPRLSPPKEVERPPTLSVLNLSFKGKQPQVNTLTWKRDYASGSPSLQRNNGGGGFKVLEPKSVRDCLEQIHGLTDRTSRVTLRVKQDIMRSSLTHRESPKRR